MAMVSGKTRTRSRAEAVSGLGEAAPLEGPNSRPQPAGFSRLPH